MKIGIFDPYLDTLGGGEKYMLTIAKSLSKTHDVSIFWDTDIESIKKLALDRFGFDLSSVLFVRNIFSPRISILQRVQIAMKYDRIIYLSDGSLPIVGKKNLIIHFQFPVEWIEGRALFTQWKLKQSRTIICNSQFTKKYIDKTFGITSQVLYPPVSILPKNSREIKKENIILHVGRFGISREGANYKKQDVLIDMFKEMIKKGTKGWQFMIVISIGENDQEKFAILQKRAEGFPITFLVNQPNNILWDMYRKAKIYWHASGFGEDLEKHPEKAEHFGIATAEAMSQGVVPIVIHAGGQPEIVQDEKTGFLWESKERCISQTTKLIKNNKLWEELSLQAKRSVVRFSEERFCAELNTLVKI